MVRWIKTDCCHISKGSNHPISIGSTNSITAILDQPKIVPFRERCDSLKIERIAQGMGNHDCTGLVRECRLKLSHVYVISGNLDIHKDRDQALLKDRVDCGWKTGCHSYHFITWLELALR